MTTAVPILTPEQVRALPRRAREVVEYRKSGLSLNHIQGCPLDCAYCIRHTYGLWDQRQPRAVLSDEEAVEQLIGHRYFMPHVTPLQLFNRATDPFLPQVKKHTFAVVDNLDHRGLRNHLLIITRYRVTDRDCEQLAATRHLRLTLLFTYSGIEDRRIEPYPSSVAALVMQQLDGVDPEYLWRINARAIRPHLAVILDADPAVVAQRLRDRGPHNRLQKPPSSAHTEWHHYREVCQRVTDAGWTIQRIDCSATTVADVAHLVRQRLQDFETSGTGSGFGVSHERD